MNLEKVIISNTNLEITSDNYDDLDQGNSRPGEKLIQKNKLKGTHKEFQFLGQHRLKIDIIKDHRSKPGSYIINLSSLSPESNYYKKSEWKWLVSSLLFFTLFILTMVFGIQEHIETTAFTSFGVTTFCGGLVFILVFYYFLRNEYIFKTEYGDAELFIVDNKNPSQAESDLFMAQLQKSINLSRASQAVSDRLINELKMCRRLRDEHIISDEIYTNVRSNIFKHHEYKPVG